MTTVTTVCFAGLGLAALLSILRLVRGTSTANRIVALDTLLVISVSVIAVVGVRAETAAYVPVALVTALMGFVGTVTVARFIERRGGER